MRRLVLILLALVAIGAGVVTAIDLSKPPPPERGGETRDRVNSDRLRRQLKPALDRLLKNDVPGAEKAFAAELGRVQARKGTKSVETADLLNVFGNALAEYRREKAALPYLRRAVATYRVVFGPESPQVAVALGDLAQALYDVDQEASPPELVAALEEALRIRRKALGMDNAETAQSYAHLGQVRGLPVNTRGDPARIDAAAQLALTALEILPRAPNADAFAFQDARFHLIEIYARNGRGPQAVRVAEAWQSDEPGYTDDQAHDIVERLERAGDMASAQALRERYALDEEKPEKED
jgi:hypothetical protein